jgi:hypothetical protein
MPLTLTQKRQNDLVGQCLASRHMQRFAAAFPEAVIDPAELVRLTAQAGRRQYQDRGRLPLGRWLRGIMRDIYRCAREAARLPS